MIKDLLARGEAAAAADDYAAAIDAWSRIFLIDHAHEEAGNRVEHLRHAMEERRRRIEPMLDDARAAHFNGDEAAATSLVEQILALDPKHVNATRLKERMDAGQPADEKPAAADSAMPDLEEDLFSDVPVSSTTEVPEGDAETAARPAEMPTLEPLPTPRGLPWRLIGFAAVGLLVVLVGLWVGSRLLSTPEPEDQTMAVNQLLRDADALFEQNKVEEAIHLLEEFPVVEAQKGRIEGRLAKYRQALAPPTPTPIPESLPKAEELLEQGQWMAAYQVVMRGLRRHPTDSGLEELRQKILQIEPDAAPLYNAVASTNYSAAASIAKDLLDLHPEQADVAAVYERCLFNAAMAELRAYNLTAAETYLTALRARQPDDPEVQRILDFIASYKVRPVDMQLEIFIRSIEER
jgi:tetratricopeptide (TPR) repeat protein